jgi:GNAT superfamily N-acetyltransferase
MTPLTIRRARPGDEDLALALLRELAVYEKIEDRFKLTREIFAKDFLGDDPRCFCELAFAGEEPAGVMTWYRTYASFSAQRGLFLEDLFVRPRHRGRGFGKTLLQWLAHTAVREGAGHIDWFVLDWNKPSIDFYDGLGAVPMTGWLSYRLRGEALAALARG